MDLSVTLHVTVDCVLRSSFFRFSVLSCPIYKMGCHLSISFIYSLLIFIYEYNVFWWYPPSRISPFQVLLPPNTFPSQFHVFLSLFYSTKSYYCYPCVWASLEYGQLLRVKLPKKNDLPAPSSHFLKVSLQLGCNLVICPPTPHWCWLGLVSCIDNHSCWNFMCSVATPCLEQHFIALVPVL